MCKKWRQTSSSSNKKASANNQLECLSWVLFFRGVNGRWWGGVVWCCWWFCRWFYCGSVWLVTASGDRIKWKTSGGMDKCHRNCDCLWVGVCVCVVVCVGIAQEPNEKNAMQTQGTKKKAIAKAKRIRSRSTGRTRRRRKAKAQLKHALQTQKRRTECQTDGQCGRTAVQRNKKCRTG